MVLTRWLVFGGNPSKTPMLSVLELFFATSIAARFVYGLNLSIIVKMITSSPSSPLDVSRICS